MMSGALTIFGFVLLIGKVTCSRVMFFQSDNIPNIDSKATFLFPANENAFVMTSFTVALWIKVHHFRDSTYVFSYATSDKDNNMLNYAIRHSSFTMAIANKYITIKKLLFFTDVWYHFIQTYDNSTGLLNFLVNGKQILERELSSRKIPLNGSLVLGQETDLYNGGFSEQQSFSGWISEFNIFKRVLSLEEQKQLVICDASAPSGDVIGWGWTSWVVSGKVEDINSKEAVCDEKRQPFQVIAEQATFPIILSLCKRLFGSSVFLPTNAIANQEFYNKSLPYLNKCKAANHATAFFWLGASDEVKDGDWTNLKNIPLNFTNFRGSEKSSSQTCAVYESPPHLYKWNDIKCTKSEMCGACEDELENFDVSFKSIDMFEPSNILRIRGLCNETPLNTFFKVSHPVEDSTKLYMKGLKRYTILPVENTSFTWQLYDMWTKRKLAELLLHGESYPLGLRKWTLTQDYAVCGQPKDTELTISLSSCKSTQFTCNDGNCVDLSKRCDLLIDCADNSDEHNCDKLRKPENYMDLLPPAGVDQSTLKINISVDIEQLSEIDILNMRLTFDLKIILSWYDQRLAFSNLKDVDDLNHIKISSVWHPSFSFPNAAFTNTHRNEAVLLAQKGSSPLMDDLSRPLRDEIFSGNSTPLIFIQQVNAPFRCEMKLENFPFDTQICHIKIKMQSARMFIAQWGKATSSYLVESRLPEYDLDPPEVSTSAMSEYSVCVVTITLRRRFAYFLTSAYLPTVMLIIISYASLFCKYENPDLRVMLSVTTLLVLFALYQQISQGLPKTSYTKSIDIWCFFAMTMIFSQVVFHVFISVHKSDLTSTMKVKDRESYDMSADWSGRDGGRYKVVFVTRIIYAIIFFLFNSLYWYFVVFQMT